MPEEPGHPGSGVAPGDGPYRYRADVLAVVARHGITPTARTPPELARGYVRELYKYEIRRLRERYLRQEFSKREYAGRVDVLRQRYGVLALVPERWLIDPQRAAVSHGPGLT
jgi:hypothetical protein